VFFYNPPMKIAHHLEQIPPSYIREILSEATAQGVISLAGGLPSPDHFPMALMSEALQSLANTPALFQYGETAGYRPLLDYFCQFYQLNDQQRGIVCTGSQQGLDLIARTFLNLGDSVVVESPSYLGALQVFGIAQAQIKTVSQISTGPDLNQLETLLSQKSIKLFYAVPDFHNPTGICWSLDTRKAVAALCQRHRVILVEDAPYRQLRFSGQALPMVSSFCPELSLVLRSFSKIATPGIRLGLLTGPAQWVESITTVKQAADLHSSQPMQAVLLKLLSHAGFTEHLDSLCALYGARYQQLSQCLQQLGDGYEFGEVQGGMFIWLKVPSGNPMTVAKAAMKNGVAVVPSTVFYAPGIVEEERGESAFRLNFTHANQKQLALAVERLKAIL
jgi:DNA-binding transcriptional MocR family regulator